MNENHTGIQMLMNVQIPLISERPIMELDQIVANNFILLISEKRGLMTYFTSSIKKIKVELDTTRLPLKL